MDVGKATDRMLDEIGTLIHRRDECKALMDLYMEGGLLMPQVASHLWEVLNGIERTEAEGSLGEDREVAGTGV